MNSPNRNPTPSSFILHLSSLILLLLLLPACLPLEPAGHSAALEARLESLERELAATRRQHQDTLDLLPPRLTDLEQRVDEAELSRTEDLDLTQTRDTHLHAQIQWLQRLFSTLEDAVISGERAVGLSLTEQNLIPTLTRYGTFLFKLNGYDKTPTGYQLHLLVTNLTPFRIHRFHLHGDFGRKSPVLPAEATALQRIETLDAWELSLAKFSSTFENVLEPGEHTPLVLSLPASRLADLEFIRLWIDVHSVTLPPPQSSPTFGSIDTSRPGSGTLHVLPSDSGIFYLKLLKSSPSPTGYQLSLLFGNPLGMTINRLRLQGFLGKKPPSPQASDPLEKREKDLLDWRLSRRPYSTEVRTTLKPMQWTEITLDLPAASPSAFEHIDLRATILELHLLPPQ